MRRKKSNSRAGLNALIAAGLAVALVACGTFLSRPRQGWNPSYGPVVPHDSFPADCSLCHTGKNWNTIKTDFVFDHEAQTGVPLNGAHKKVGCLLCHNDRGPAGEFAAQGCAGCHQDIHRGQLGRLCADCHSEDNWLPVGQIAKHNQTRFPLIGAHVAVACFECHPGAEVGNFSGADTACVSCHQADLSRAVNPNHVAQGWVTDCQRCHTPVAWQPARFNHPSSFPLTGGHSGHDCSACHQGGVYTGLSTACNACHMPDYQATTNPNHVAANFPTTCNNCHNTVTWQGATFNHPSSFPLTAGHAGHACAACHQGGVYTGLSTACVSCHLSDYQGTTNPNHVASNFPTNCQNCHNTSGWQGANFVHPATFPLTGGHAGHACSVCHQGGVYTGLSTACATCHQSEYQATTNPSHVAAAFSTSCNTCHTTTTWQPATFTHTSNFPLTGGHSGQTCNTCHQSGVYAGLSSACSTCHMQDYQGTTNPNHTAAMFPTTCNTCHTTTTWQGATFTHSPFIITSGPHQVSCNQCHLNSSNYQQFTCTGCHTQSQTLSHHTGVSGYQWVSSACYSCHPQGRR